MSSPNSPTLNEVVGNIIEDVLKESAKQAANQETVPAKEVREETEEVEVEAGEARIFFTNKGVENFNKIFAKKGFVEEKGFKELVPPFKEEVERRGWEML